MSLQYLRHRRSAQRLHPARPAVLRVRPTSSNRSLPCHHRRQPADLHRDPRCVGGGVHHQWSRTRMQPHHLNLHCCSAVSCHGIIGQHLRRLCEDAGTDADQRTCSDLSSTQQLASHHTCSSVCDKRTTCHRSTYYNRWHKHYPYFLQP